MRECRNGAGNGMSASGAAGANVGPLDVQDVVALPLPATVVPNSFTFTHDDVSITFLHDDSGSTVRSDLENRSLLPTACMLFRLIVLHPKTVRQCSCI